MGQISAALVDKVCLSGSSNHSDYPLAK
jgi:hypothetical protein